MPPGEKAPLLYAGPRVDRVVALTIDDGYSPSVVRCELAILQRDRVNATFFPIGVNVAASAELWRHVSASGFPIGNHTWDHPILTGRTYDQIRDEIRRGNEAIRSATGRAPIPFLRPPGGDWNDTVLVAAHAEGEIAVVNWDTSLGDSGRGPVSQLLTNGERGRPGSIILMHGSDPRSAAALPQIISFYRAAGYRFVTLGQLLNVPGPVPYPETAEVGAGTPAGSAASSAGSLASVAGAASLAASTASAAASTASVRDPSTLSACALSSSMLRVRSRRRRSGS